MTKQDIFLGLGILVLLALGGASIYPKTPAEDVSDDIDENATSTSKVVEARIDQSVSALGVKITPLEVVEDSRCPSDVVCIWAGTVKVRATLESGLGSAEQIFELNQPVTTEAEIITLVSVEPETKAGVKIEPSQHVFHFQITKR